MTILAQITAEFVSVNGFKNEEKEVVIAKQIPTFHDEITAPRG